MELYIKKIFILFFSVTIFFCFVINNYASNNMQWLKQKNGKWNFVYRNGSGFTWLRCMDVYINSEDNQLFCHYYFDRDYNMSTDMWLNNSYFGSAGAEVDADNNVKYYTLAQIEELGGIYYDLYSDSKGFQYANDPWINVGPGGTQTFGNRVGQIK